MVRFLGHYISVRGVFARLVEAALLALACWLLQAKATTGLGTVVDGALMDGAIGGIALHVAISIGVLQAFAMYQRHRASRREVALRLAVVYLFSGAAQYVLSLMMPELLPQYAISSSLLAGTLALSFVVSFALRLVLARLTALLLPAVKVLVIGNDPIANEVATILRATDPLEGIELCGVIDSRDSADASSIASLIEAEGIGEVVIATTDQRGLPLAELLRYKLGGVLVTDYVSFLEREKCYLAVDVMRPSWLLFSDGFGHGPVRGVAKRLFDLVVSAALLLLLSPILLVAMLAIRLGSGAPVFYRQARVGVDGHPITILKLRSMDIDAEGDGVARWASANDSRVTRIGRFLRMTRIDEIPQLFSVLSGDMSFVGPRPERAFFVEQLREQVPFYDLRHAIKPGLSGWAQVSYPYGASIDDARAKLRYDLYYIKNHSLLLDILILLNTVRIVVFGTGAR